MARLIVDYGVLRTGEHYLYTMDRVFFEQLELPEARYNLDVGSGTHAEQTGIRIAEFFAEISKRHIYKIPLEVSVEVAAEAMS
jgi:UDP-N-acetylglucosamine 2-epimerase